MIEQLSIAQGFGFISLVLGILTFYQKDDRKLKIMMLLLQLNHVIHYMLLGSLISAFSALLSALRTATAIYISSKIVAMAFIVVGLISGIVLADSLWDLLPVIGMMIGTYAIFVLKGIQLRIGLLASASFWLINNIVVGSIGGTLLELTNLAVNGATVFRLLREQRELVESKV